MVAITVEALVDAPCPRVGVTVTGLGSGEALVSLWRSADGVRSPVRGYRRVTLSDAAYAVDYDAPLGRKVTYEVEVLSSSAGPSRKTSAPVVVSSDSAWIMDPLLPESAVSIRRRMGRDGNPVFMVDAMREFEYEADVSMLRIMGDARPMSLIGQRAAATGVNISLVSDMAEQNARIRDLMSTASQLLVRVPPSVSESIEGSCFLAVATVSETSRKPHTGSALTTWRIVGDSTQAPTIKVLTVMFTWGDVAILYDTYQQKLDSVVAAAAAAGVAPTYLFDQKNPTS